MGENDVKMPFWNMATATLMRVDSILRQLNMLNYLYPYQSVQEQKQRLRVTKDLFESSVPLLINVDEREAIEKYKHEFFKMKMETKSVIKNGNQKIIEVWDPKLDYRLREICTEIQSKIHVYFMPPKQEDDDDEL